jgi:hypothetical protein
MQDGRDMVYLTVHVDDMLLASPTTRFRLEFEQKMGEYFEISCQVNKITYLGMSVVKDAAGISVHQLRYIETLGIKFGVDPDVEMHSPTGSNFLSIKEDDESMGQSTFLSVVISLMYLARFTRPDILMPTTYLATRYSHPG